MPSTTTSPATTLPGELLQQGLPPLKIEPAILSRWIIGFRSAIIIGFIMIIASLPILTHMYTIDRSDTAIRMLGPVFFSTGIYLLAIGVFFEKILRGYREYMRSLNVTVGDSNVGAYVRTTELFHDRPVVVRPPPHFVGSLVSAGTSEESNFVEIVEPYASFSNLGVPPPPYRF